MRLRIAALHLFVLWAFAVAQPLFDLLGKNGEFFAARGSTRWDVVLFAVVLLLVPPVILTGAEALTPGSARGAVHAAFVAALVGLFTLQAIRGAGGTGWLLVAIAAALGAAAATVYARFAGAGLILTVLAPAPLLFLALFLLHSDASRLTFSGTDEALAAGAHAKAPVVLVAFDELPMNSLRDSNGRIDAVRFPHFAALAAGSTWFANTSTVAEGTTHAVPAILTGRFPRADEFPVYTDHRQNLFTLLGGAADLHVLDQDTHLCPPKLCPGLEGSFGGRMRGLAEDTGVVYLHQLLPDDLTGGIPSIANGWDNFLRDTNKHDDLGAIPPAFRRSLRPGPRPALWYVHLLLPHSPWRYLPSGRRYSIRQAPGWGGDEVWTANQAAVDQYWQRHLLQLGYADHVLGRLIAHLHETGLYDRALIVVTADHGVSFRAGEKRRPLSELNLEDIAYVPLFVKLPQQHGRRVERAPARTIDVVPTIADALDVRIPWHVDGRSLLDGSHAEREVVLIKDGGKRFVVPTADLQARRERALQRQLRLFGSGEPLSGIYGVGPGRERVNHSIEGRRLDARLDAIDLSSDPVQVSGRVPESIRAVAVAAGGRVLAVAPAEGGRFWALVPRARLHGANPLIYALKARS
ncbi:MAG TPA: sulfatase-like hydrolase/transferase [Gaiellaceae bacterium]|nr:sulfatase-like hydrolase/transferase [Gaiellaceae bacterium]